MNNVLLWLGGLLVAILGLLFFGPHFVDWTRYRGVFEEEASRVLGRELRVAGAVNLRLLPTPYVRFEKVRLSDAAGQTGEPFFRADDFTLWLSPAPLLRGAIEAREIELHRPTLKLRLNAQGGGNWQTLSIARGQLPFVPSDVALQSVQITDGTVSVDGPDGRELARVAAVTGELSVAALDGPFRFKGAFGWGGVAHELKASTTSFEQDGSLRIKAQVAVPSASRSYVFDGRLADLSNRVKLDGQLTGQFSFLPGNIGQPAGAANSLTKSAAGVPLELRAMLSADAAGATFSDIGLSFEQNGKPQLVTGNAAVAWNGGLDVKTELSARWLDLDQILGQAGSAVPLSSIRRLASALTDLVPSSGRGQSIVSVDQLTLGSEALSDARIRVERDNDVVRLPELKVSLPGGTRAQLSGVFPKSGATETFEGDVTLRGASLARLLGWIGQGTPIADGRTDGAFSLRSKIGFDSQSIVVKDAFASLGSAALTGGVSFRWAERSRLDVVLEGDQIDLTLVAPHVLDLLAQARAFAGLAGENKSPAKAAATAGPVIDPKSHDVSLRIRTGRLILAERELRDVDVDAALVGGRLNLQRLHFSNGAGLEVDAEGDIADAGGRRRGSLRGTLSAGDQAAIGELLDLMQVAPGQEWAKRALQIAPARIGWSLKLADPTAAAGPTAVDVWLDGAVLGRRLAGTIRLEGGLAEWRHHLLQLNVALERPDWSKLRTLFAIDNLAAAASGSGVALAATSAGARGKLLLAASGRPDQGLSTYLRLDDEAFDAGISGKITIEADKIAAAEGELQLRTSDAGLALAALGLPARNVSGIAVEGAAELSLKDDRLKITPSALEVSGAVVGGELLVTKMNDRLRFEGKVTTSYASVPRLFELLVAPKAGGIEATSRNQPATDASVWSNAAFDFGLIDRSEGRIRFEAAELAVAPELGVGRATADVVFGAGKVDVQSLEGDLLGSRMTSRWLLEKVPAGANLSASAKVTGARLDQLPASQAAGGHRMAGTASISVSANGRGLTPRGLVTALTGKGEIDVAKGDAGHISPQLVRRIANDVITGKREPTVEAVEQAVLMAVKPAGPGERLGLGNRKLTFDVADGAVKVAPFAVETPEGIAANRTTIDLASLKIDSEWKLEERFDKPVRAVPAPGVKQPTPLPPVTVVFVGPVAALGRLEPVVSVEALVRELAVRRMERDVEELERLRRLDEERAKAEAERKRIEAAGRAAAAAAAAAMAMPGQTQVPGIPGQPGIPIEPLLPSTTPAPDEAATAVTDAPPLADGKPRPASGRSGIASEPRQVPSSQSLKKSWMQDVFKSQGGRGN